MTEAVKIASTSELAPGDRKRFEIDGRALILFRIGDDYYVIDDLCTHDGEPLDEGELFDDQVECPRHGARFNVRTGAAVRLPAIDPVPTHPVEVRDGDVLVRVDD